MSTLVTRKHHRSASREQVAQYSPGFTPIGPIYRLKRKIYLLQEGATQNQGRREAQVLRQEKQIRSASIKLKKKAAQKIQRDISSLKAKCKELEEKRIAIGEVYEPQDNVGNQFGDRKGKNQKNMSD